MVWGPAVVLKAVALQTDEDHWWSLLGICEHPGLRLGQTVKYSECSFYSVNNFLIGGFVGVITVHGHMLGAYLAI